MLCGELLGVVAGLTTDSGQARAALVDEQRVHVKRGSLPPERLAQHSDQLPDCCLSFILLYLLGNAAAEMVLQDQ